MAGARERRCMSGPCCVCCPAAAMSHMTETSTPYPPLHALVTSIQAGRRLCKPPSHITSPSAVASPTSFGVNLRARGVH